MRNRVLVGVGAGLLAAALLAGVATVAYKAGGGREAAAVRDGEVARVVHDGWDRGPGFGFLVFPLLFTGLVVLAASGWARRGPGWYGSAGHHGWPSDGERLFADWHRRAHEGGTGTTAGPPNG